MRWGVNFSVCATGSASVQRVMAGMLPHHGRPTGTRFNLKFKVQVGDGADNHTATKFYYSLLLARRGPQHEMLLSCDPEMRYGPIRVTALTVSEWPSRVPPRL